MKKWIYLILFAIIALVSFNLFYSAKTHVEAVQVADELIVKTDSLDKKVKVLAKEKDSALKEIETLDSALVFKDQLIEDQKTSIRTLRRDTAALKKIGPIIIHDTIYITETKNFWGKKKKTIEKTSTTDTLEVEGLEQDSIMAEPDSTE
jgi:hypothetical protein